ncbi:MAG: FG-GAP-like repeat-containing protein, partial [Planctomycetota bacterium]
MTESDYASHRVPLPLWVFATLVTVAAVAVIFFLPPGDNEFVVDPPPNGDPTLGPLSDAEMIEIANLRNLGIAHLENANLDEAVSEFSRLSELAPGERLPMQNLAIALLMQLDPESGGHIDRSKEPDRYALAADRARETIDTLLTTFPSDTVPLLLLSRLHSLTEQLPQTIEELITAAGIDGDDPAVSYELYSVIHEARDASRNSIASEALARVWKAEPDNLHVFKERLLFLARERSSQDRGDAPTFEVDAEDLKVLFQAGRDLLRPFEQKIENFARVNVLELADVGAAAVDSGDWNTVVRNASIIGNVINPEVATQNDRKRVSPHHLEFIVRDFSDQFLAAHALPQPAFPAPIDVTFQQTTLPLEKSAVKVTRIADMNLDRRPDLVTLHDKAITVWTKSSETWTESFSTDIGSGLSGLCLFDVDRDAEDVRFETDGEAIMHAEADMDAVVYGESGISVLHNVLDKETGKRQFSPVSQADEFNALKNVLAVLPVDFDHDGDLDLVVSAENGISLWLNRDDSTFAENSQFSVLPPADARIQQMIAVDWDRNVSIDVVCLGHNTAGYLQNVLHGQLRWQPFAGNGESLKEATTLALLDADASFSWDLAAATGSGTQLFATANPDAGVTQFTPAKSLSEAAVTGVTTCDYDNDGFLDLVTWQDTILSVLRGGPLGQFEAAETLRTELPSDIQTVEVGDIDADGDLDSIVTCTDSVVLLANDGGNANHWIELPIRAESALEAQKRSERVNLHGIGSFVELQAGSLYQPRVVTGASTHFGLGQLDAADSVRVLWTNGVPEHVIHPQHRQALVLQQNLKGSCPYLYTWDGEKFAFYTDCLWAAPVGLQPVEGQLLPPREWEYLKVDGDALTPRDGEYVLKLT